MTAGRPRGTERTESGFEQTIAFTHSRDGVKIAYALSGRGQPLVKTANWLTHLEFDCRTPLWRHWLDFLSRETRLLRYDERGNGLSDHDVEDLSFARWVEDLEDLADHVGLDRFSLLGISQGGAVALEYAARHPGRVERLVLYGAYAVGWVHRDDEVERRRAQALLELVECGWGADNPAYRTLFANLFAPDADEAHARSFSELQRLSTEPDVAARLIEAAGRIDIRSSLGKIRTPTMVMHARNDARVPFDQGRLLAASIPGATFVPLESRNHALLSGDPAWPVFKAEFRNFLRGAGGAADGPGTALRIRAEFGELTPRELAVVEQVAAGLDNAEVGRRLRISEKTVRNHLTRIFEKLGVRTRAQLIVRMRDS
jgi:pimeloyl-ACP methyl ester carboxylesterase/DNA-binding CsgD family transcriptional regulator